MMDQQQPQPLMQTDEGQQAWTLHRLYPATKRAAEIRQGIWTALLQGIPNLSRFLKSVRVGSGSATLAASDGLDGLVMADGALAAFVTRDRTTSTKYVTFYKDGTVRLLTQEAGTDIWLISPTTGILTQASLSTITRGTNISATDIAGSVATGCRIVKPTGEVYVQLSLVATGAIAALSVIATLPTGFFPAGNVAFVGRKNLGTAVSGAVNSVGQVVIDAALANTDTFAAVFGFMP